MEIAPQEEIDPASRIVTLADLKIRTKRKQLRPFVPNFAQTHYLDVLAETYPGFEWQGGAPMIRGAREDILKSRQLGWSTLWLALYFLDTINTPLTQSIVVAHDADSTERLFQIITRFYDNLPEEKRRPTRYSSKRLLHFEDIDSLIFVGTAGARNTGRGGTINNVHMSERAFWDDGANVEASLMESVPLEGNVTRETTANGLNEYYQAYQESVNRESEFHARFYGWTWDPENSLTEAEYHRLAPKGGDTDGEAALLAVQPLTEGQIYWRRWKKANRKELFPQEHPFTPTEAFVASGNPAFNRAYLMDLIPVLRGDDWQPERVETSEESSWNGTLSVFVEPEEDVDYLIVADPSEGIDEYGNHDYAVAHVYHRETWEQVAHYRGRPDPHRFGIDLDRLGRMYNVATLCVLRNNHGHSVLNTLINACYYPKIHYHVHFDEYTRTSTTKAGFPETPRSKSEAVGDLESLIEGMAQGESGFIWRQINTVEELVHYVKKEGKKTGAERGSHDDEVSCCYTAAALLPQYTQGWTPRRERPRREPVASAAVASAQNLQQMPASESRKRFGPAAPGRFGKR